ncbi:MAG: nuclear transport factor 2 family protein [Rhodothermales bacterium]
MDNQAQTEHEAIRSAVRTMNERWRAKQYDRIGALLADGGTPAPSGFGSRVRGRGAYVQSYRDYDEAVTTLEFSAGGPEVDIVGDVAVAVCSFSVMYEIDGVTHREHGHDLLVFSRCAGEWKVVWRTMQFSSDGENAC